ncbi:MAG TPA: DUF222 domain-containing protein [Sporichthyaceae bacterium]|jgi:hypothetical protein|nr:DUF222 domain-containing protein [Sporichthyaceae bacterium]
MSSDPAATTPVLDAAELEWLFSSDVPECGSGFDTPEDAESFGVESRELALIASCERQIPMLHGIQVKATAEFVAQTKAEMMFDWPGDAERSATAEIGLLLGLSPRAASGRVTEAAVLVERFPRTVEALCDGLISSIKARIVLEESANLPDSQCAALEAAVLPKAVGLVPSSLRRAVRRAVEKLDAEAVVKRAAAARLERSVQLWAEPNGMATVTAKLPVEQAFAVFGIIDALAHENRAPGESRTIDQLRADALVELVCRPGDVPARVTHEVRILVPANLLLGTGAEAGRMADGTPIPTHIAEAIATDARWRRILTDPADGSFLDLSPNTYAPSNPLGRFVRARDQRCRFPGCRQPADRCDIDHTISFLLGGRTVRINLGSLCRAHHRVKHLPGWICSQEPDGTLTFTTPHGETYRTRPPTADAAERSVERLTSVSALPPF